MVAKIFRALIPAIVTGFLFWFLIALTQGMDRIGNTPGAWFWVGFFIFQTLFVLVSGGEKILGRFFKYLAYEFWAIPIMMIVYSISSVGQASQTAGVIGGIGAGIGGSVLIVLAVIVGGFGGLIFFLIGNSINKRKEM